MSPSAWVQVPQGGRQGVIRADELCSAPLGVSGTEKCALGTLQTSWADFPGVLCAGEELQDCILIAVQPS